MKLLATRCAMSASCPSISDPEDGTGELIVTGDTEDGQEVSVRIARELLEEALKSESN